MPMHKDTGRQAETNHEVSEAKATYEACLPELRVTCWICCELQEDPCWSTV
jgi:hypothetical protein